MDTLVGKLISTAKVVAKSEGLKVLELGSVVVALAALQSEQAFTDAAKQVLGVAEIIWPDQLLSRSKAFQFITAEDVSNQTFELGPVFRHIYNALVKPDPSPDLTDFLRAILTTPDALTCEEVKALNDAQKSGKHQADSSISTSASTTLGMLSSLRSLAEKARAIESTISSEVIGQQDAVRMLSQGYLRAITAPKPKGLRGIFTFMGPPGVGKTMLAECFAKALSSVEGEPYETQKFSMEMSDDQGLLYTLFGVDSAYKTTKTGIINDKIKANPHQVLVFDEIEKAPATIIQALLTLLNDGSFRDIGNLELVDLSKCFVIFTTNLGYSLFESRLSMGILRGSVFSSDQLFDLLASAKRREQSNSENAASVLSPEFVSRLRKGSAVLFNQLYGSDYLRLIDTNLRVLGSSTNSSLPVVNISDEAKQLLVLSLLPDISPRRVAGEIEVIVGDWIRDLIANPPENLLKADPQTFSMAVGVPGEGSYEPILSSMRAAQQLKLLVVDDDQRMTRFISNYHDATATNIISQRVDASADVVEQIFSEKPDLLMLDLDFPEAKLPAGGILAVHRQIVEAAPDLPIFLFSDSSSWEARIPALIEQGGARGFFSFSHLSEDIIISQDQEGKFRRLLADTLFEKILADYLRRRMKLELESSISFEPLNSLVQVTILPGKERQIVSLSDETGGIHPAEIPNISLDDVFGLDRAKERLRDAIQFMKHPEILLHFKGISPPSGYLLAGPSGTGKTHLARAVAHEAGGVFYSLSAGELESKWVGESEERIRKIFAAARKYAPAVIFIDEIDAIASRRSSGESSGTSYNTKLLNQLLTCMDGFSGVKGQVLVLAATNRPDVLDPAILRPGRFDETIRIEAPDIKARQEMLRMRLQTMPLSEGVLEGIPRLVCRSAGMSPAEVDRVLREAAYRAAREKRVQITIEDLESAVNLVRFGADRRDMTVKEQDRRLTAWHEAGHAVARLELISGAKIDFISIVPNEAGALGFTAHRLDEEKHNSSARDLKNQIIVLLAGREAERLCPRGGDEAFNTGASSDYERATATAWSYVSQYGFDEEFGVFSLSGVPEGQQAELSGVISKRVQKLLEESLADTRLLLKEKMDKLASLAQALLEKDALDEEEVNTILGRR